MKTFSSNTVNLTGQRVDSNNVMFFDNELTAYDPKEYDELKAELSLFKIFKSDVLPAADRFKDQYEYKMFNSTGKSKILSIANGKATDIPYVGVSGQRNQSPIVNVACKVDFSDGDLLAAAATQRDIIGRLGDQAMRSNFEEMNSLGFYGDKVTGVPGIYTNKFIDSAPLGHDWKANGVTPEEIYSDLIAIYNAIKSKTKNVISPDTCLVASELYNILDSTIFNIYTRVTVKEQFESAKNVKIIDTLELGSEQLVDALGGALKDCVFMFKNRIDFISPIVSNWFEMRPLQVKDLRYESICTSGFGGVVVRMPAACRIGKNAT